MRKSAAARVATRGHPRPLSLKVADGVAWLRLERPEAGNRITQRLAQALSDAAAEIELDEAVVAVVLAAAGRSFCLGIEDGGTWERRIDWAGAIGRLTRPVIAALQGDAFAEGLELALCCDLRIASDRARFAMPQLRMGRLPSHGGTQRLPRIVGRMRALDLLLTGRTLDATEAYAIGLASRVVPHTSFPGVLKQIVAALRAKGPIALRYAKEAVLKGSDLTLDQGIRLEEDLYVLLQTTRDRREGVAAFLKKRKPVFRGC
ncbi:MAG: enoyl-CoA hydratase/isomerase family protein [Candidatus Binatia bacterium]